MTGATFIKSHIVNSHMFDTPTRTIFQTYEYQGKRAVIVTYEVDYEKTDYLAYLKEEDGNVVIEYDGAKRVLDPIMDKDYIDIFYQ